MGHLGLLVSINMVVMMVASIAGLIGKIKLFFLKRKMKKHMADLAKQKLLQDSLKDA